MLVILLIGLAILTVVFVKLRFLNIAYCARQFEKQNVIVCGKKGTGKDCLFSMVINKRKKKCYSNIDFGKHCEVRPISYCSVAPNDYHDLIYDRVSIIPKTIEEKVDYYLSDGGIYLPSQYDGELSRRYKSLPIFYALSRHLGAMNVHCNTQNINRLWLKLREQADYYITTKGCLNLGLWLLVKSIHYEHYDDCLNNRLPIGGLFKGDYSRVENSSRGKIKVQYYLIPKRYLTFDTRHFHKVFYGVPAPRKSKKKRGKKNEKTTY